MPLQFILLKASVKSRWFWVGLCLLWVSGAQAQPLRFARDFAALEGYVKPQEVPWRQELCLNGSWQFQPVAIPRGYQRNQGIPPELPPPGADWEPTPIRIPSPWNANTYGCGRDVGAGTKHPYWPDSVWFPSYPKTWDGVQMGWLRRRFIIPRTWQNDRIWLHFEAVAGGCQILVNGQPAGTHFEYFLPFQMDITALVNRTGTNELCVGISIRIFMTKPIRFITMNAPPTRMARTWTASSGSGRMYICWECRRCGSRTPLCSRG